MFTRLEPAGFVETREAGHECHIVDFDGVVRESEQFAVHVRIDVFADCDGLSVQVEARVGWGEVLGAGDGAGGIFSSWVWVCAREGKDEGGHVDYLLAVGVNEAEGCACFQSCGVAVGGWNGVFCGAFCV